MAQALSTDKSDKYNSMQTLVHRDCHYLPKPHMGAHALSIPMLMVNPKLHENALALEVSLVIYTALLSVFLVTFVYLLLLKHLFHQTSGIKGNLMHSFVILAKIIFDRSW
jgi:hypothetical protein